MESELVDPGWMKFNCKSGELMFYYNKDTAEHKFPMWNSTSREYCIGKTIDGELLHTNKNNSIAIQTDDTGCSNGCTSMYVENGCILQQSNLERDIPRGSEESCVSGDTNVFMDDVDVDDNEVTGRRLSSGSNEKESVCGSIENRESEIKVEINCTDEDIPGGSEESSVSGDANVFMDDVDVVDNEVTARRVSSGSNEKDSTSGSIDNTDTEIKVEINWTDADRTDQTNAISTPSNYTLWLLSSVSHPLPDETFEVPSVQNDIPAEAIKKHHCSHCNKAFRYRSTCRVHERIHSGVKPYKCKHCSKTFTQSVSCISHERIHSGEKPYKCKHCSKTFAQIGNCISHERIHSGEKPYKCRHCSMTFRQSSTCRAHERIHSGEKTYKCRHCSKTFTECRGCRSHERIHSEEKPYKCKHCSKTFTLSSYCRRHERIHSEEKPYQCKHCSKTFKSNSNCRRHERAH